MTDWAAYKRKQREARREAGLVRVEVWVKPENREAVRRFAESLERGDDEE